MIIGSIIARYFKHWDPTWFYLHASIQAVGFVAGVIGIFSGLALSKKLDADVSHHKNIAILIIVLGFLQVHFSLIDFLNLHLKFIYLDYDLIS